MATISNGFVAFASKKTTPPGFGNQTGCLFYLAHNEAIMRAQITNLRQRGGGGECREIRRLGTYANGAGNDRIGQNTQMMKGTMLQGRPFVAVR